MGAAAQRHVPGWRSCTRRPGTDGAAHPRRRDRAQPPIANRCAARVLVFSPDAGCRRWRAPVDQDTVDRYRPTVLHGVRARFRHRGRVVPSRGPGQARSSGGESAYFRLSTRPVDQGLAALPSDEAAPEHRRQHVLSGAYAIRRTLAPPTCDDLRSRGDGPQRSGGGGNVSRYGHRRGRDRRDERGSSLPGTSGPERGAVPRRTWASWTRCSRPIARPRWSRCSMVIRTL